MIHNKEWGTFTRCYVPVALVFGFALCALQYGFWEQQAYGSRQQVFAVIKLTMIWYGVLVTILYLMIRFCLKGLYGQMEGLATQMEDCLKEDFKLQKEEYADGTLGKLYSNFHKVQRALQEAKEREHQEKMFLKDTISDISHQLKTPLASLTVFLDLLHERKLATREEEDRILGESKNQLQRMEWMVLSMLKLARLEANAIVFDKAPVNLLWLLRQSVDSLRVRYEEKQITVSILCEETLELELDRDWMQEALVNLIKNAIDYTPENGAVTLLVEATNVYTRIVVEDNGMGIRQEDLAHVFDRFARGGNNTNTNSVGIGLALVKSIVQGQGGTIRVDSKRNQYTRFTITFVS